jgi:hypothetical protein
MTGYRNKIENVHFVALLGPFGPFLVKMRSEKSNEKISKQNRKCPFLGHFGPHHFWAFMQELHARNQKILCSSFENSASRTNGRTTVNSASAGVQQIVVPNPIFNNFSFTDPEDFTAYISKMTQSGETSNWVNGRVKNLQRIKI